MTFKNLAKWYVYELSDIAGNVFYVGKGSANRMHAHIKEARKGVCSKKCNKIRKLNYEIKVYKVASFWDEQEAYNHETDRIELYGLGTLTNIMPGGQRAWDRRLWERKVFSKVKTKKTTPFTKKDAIELIKKNKKLFAYCLKYRDDKSKITAEKTGEGFQDAVSEIWAWFFTTLGPQILKTVGL
jgi:hypothetical protein